MEQRDYAEIFYKARGVYHMNAIPVLAVSAGDPAGIGAEIVVKAFSGVWDYQVKPVIVCDQAVLLAAAGHCEISLDIPAVSSQEALRAHLAAVSDNSPVIYDCNALQGRPVPYGTVDAACGAAAYTYIAAAVELIQAGIAEVLVTGPINKESLQAAGVPYIGHTEILGGLTGTEDPLTMFETLGLRIFFLSRHVSLSKACTMVTEERVSRYIDRCLDALKQLGDDQTRPLAAAGLNPHSGEHGLFGNEDEEAVRPAVEKARLAGNLVVGPIGADSVFHQAKIGMYSAVLSLYHDQGHIAAKTLDFERTVSVTLGLPFLRTSVDHGTAFDIAGTGAASAISMIEALRVAARYAPLYIAAGKRD